MGNTNDPTNPFRFDDIRVISDPSNLEEEGLPSENTLLTFSNPLPDKPSDFRTGQSEKLQGLVRDLANARVDAAKEVEDMRKQAARNANARLLSTLASKSLTQGLTGLDVGSTQERQRAEQSLQEAEEAEREAESKAESLEETAPVQADVKAAQIEQEAQQRAQEQAAKNKRANAQQEQKVLDTIKSARDQARSYQVKTQLNKQEYQRQRNLIDLRYDRKEDLAEIRSQGVSSGFSSEEIKKDTNEIRNFFAGLQTLKNELQSALEATKSENTDEGQITEAHITSVRKTVNDLLNKSGGDQPGIIEKKQNLMGRDLWQRIPREQREKARTLIDAARTLAGAGDASKEPPSAQDYEDLLRGTSNLFFDDDGPKLSEWQPNQVAPDVAEQTLRSKYLGSDESNDDDSPQGIGTYWDAATGDRDSTSSASDIDPELRE